MIARLAAALLALSYPSAPSTYEPPPRYESTVDGVAAFIVDVTPEVPMREAARVANIIVRVCEKHGVEPLLLAAIVRHESAFRRNALNCHANGCDRGMGQINDVHVGEMGLDPKRLVRDDAYNLNVAATLLARARTHEAREGNWWSRYHDGRRSRRRVWEAFVRPYLTRAFGREEELAWRYPATSSAF